MYSKHRQKNGHTSPATWARLLVFLAVLLLSGAPGRAGGHTGAEGLRRGRTVTAQWLSQGRIKREAETLPQVEYPVRGEIALSSNDLQLVLQVERNHELLGPDFTETYYTDDGQPVTVTNRNYTYHCFYHGHVRGHPESWVAVSTCSGVRGLISLNSSNTYYLEPVSGVDPLHHSLLNAEELPINGGNCGHGHHTAQSIHFSELLRPFHLRVKRNTWGTTKYMELYIVADNTLFKRQNKDYEKTKARIMEIANYVDKFYRDLNIRVPLIGLEVWTERDQCIVTEEPNATLWSFLQWRQKLKSRKKHDNAQLLTGVIFKGTTIGMAPLEGMCSLENSGGINVDHSELSIGAAATMAHEIGHNFGMSHDHEGCCVEATAEQGGCVMAAATGLDDMMFLPFSPPPSTSFFPVFLLLLLFLPPSLVSSSLFHTPLSWTSPHDPCYHLDGRPRHCLSEFINAAYGVPVNASHSLQEPDYDSNVTTLTDLHNPHNLTCWMAHRGTDIGEWELTVPLGRRFEITYISLQFCHQGEPSDPISISILKSMDYGRTWRPMQHYSSNCLGDFGLPSQTVAQTRHQETEPLCSDPRPLQKQRGGMVLAFSTLDGRPSSPDFDHSHALQDWVTATDIRVVFHQVSKVAKMGGLDRADESKWRDSQEDHREAGLLRWRAGHKGRAEDQVNKLNTDNALGFFNRETKHSRNKGEKVDKNERKGHGKGSGQDEDGHNVTSKERVDIFGIDTLPSSKKGGKGRGRGKKKENDHWLPCPNGGCNWTVDGRSRGNKGRDLRKRRNNNLNMRQSARNLQAAMPSVLIPPAHAPLALSDLQVGGRCKCNGHASRCRRDDAGRAVCVCEHHTAGPDCDVCEDFHFDRPWHRATPTHPNPCVACECNGHSNKCRFSMEIFQQSGRRSGGVCQKCRHHTAGRHCQYCQNGYTRDHSKPLDHRKACQPCHCHPLGAVGRWCNQTSGQCLCREGVTGARCNRCTAGYKQGKSPLRPCIRIQEVAPTPAYQPQYSIAEECVSYCQPSQVKVRMNLETYCLKDYVLKVQVRGMERSGPWWQFSISVQTVYRTGSTSRVRRGPHSLWVPDRDLGCGCPALHVGRTYLLIGAEEGERGWGPEESRLVADRSTLALQWREHWSPKLRGFRGHDKRGRCPAKSPNSQRREQTKPQAGYIPPHLLTEKDTDNVNTHSVKVDKTQTLAEPHTHPPTETSPSPFTRALVCSTPLPE